MPLNIKAAKKYRSFDLPVSYRIGESRDRLKDALNTFSNQGRLETRFGRSLYNSTLLAGPVLSMSYFKTAAGVRYLLAKVGTTLYSVASTGAHVAIKTDLSATTKHRGITWARGSTSRHIISIEGDGLFQWNGTTFTELGQDPPLGHTVATTTGSLTNATYRVFLSFYSSTTGFETNASASAEVTTTAQGILVSNIPTVASNATIDKIRVYLENKTISGEPLFVSEIALGSLTTSITTNPASVVTIVKSNAKPMTGGGKYLAEYNHKLVYAGNASFKNDVFFSEADVPDAFNDGQGPNRLVLFAGGNGEITGIATGLYNNSVLDPYLVVFKKRSTEVFSEISGESRSVLVSREIGCVSHETIINKNGNIYFLSDQGWRVIENGRLVTDESGNTATLGLGDIDDIFTQPGYTYEVNKAQASNAFSVYYSTLDQYLTWVPEGASVDLTKTYSYEFRVGGFKPYTFNTPSLAACVGEDANGMEVVFMGDANGAIYTHSVKEEKGSDANQLGVAQAVSAFAVMVWIDGDDLDSSYNWRELILKRVAGSGNLTVRAQVNYSVDETGDSYLFEGPDSGFMLDINALDSGALNEDGRTIEVTRADINRVGQNILIGFYQNEIGSSMAIINAQLEFNKNGNKN